MQEKFFTYTLKKDSLEYLNPDKHCKFEAIYKEKY